VKVPEGGGSLLDMMFHISVPQFHYVEQHLGG
jgi:hypothetical protein